MNFWRSSWRHTPFRNLNQPNSFESCCSWRHTPFRNEFS
ncbi:hypothetical protein URS_2215 [Acinetobacter ursingii]|nr:hypothetical protein URS_2215 [Acinetobacter ursingii]